MRLLAALLVAVLAPAQEPAQQYTPDWDSLNRHPTPSWFAEARFGIFIHWGVYSVPAFCDTSTYSEWYWHWLETGAHGGLERRFHHEQYGEGFAYEDFAPRFRAELWDPAAWASIFRRAGARYVVLSTKHHDGFCLWPSEVASEVRGRPWNSVATGPGRDLVGELTDAVRAEGLRMGLYYSFLEWNNPLFDRDREAYVDRVMIPQIEDLMTRYRPSILWPDGEWNHPDTLWRSTEILAGLYNDPDQRDDLVVNDRWGKGLRGAAGDFYTTEYGHHAGPGTLSGRRPFEECRGVGGSFAFNRAEGYDDYMSRTECVRLLIDLVSRGGNLLLDIGPTADGRIPLIMVDRLLAMGRWLDVHGDSIHGAGPAALRRTPWGRATRRGDTLYLHLYGWPEDGRVEVAGLRSEVARAWMPADGADRPLPVRRSPRGWPVVDLAGRHPDPHATVVALEPAGHLDLDGRLLPDAGGRLVLHAAGARITGDALRRETDTREDARTTNLGYWTSTADRASWTDIAFEPGRRYRVIVDAAVAPGQEGGTLAIDLGDHRLEHRFERPTGGWHDYRTITVGEGPAPKDGTVTVHALAIPAHALANLRRITLVPVE